MFIHGEKDIYAYNKMFILIKIHAMLVFMCLFNNNNNNNNKR